MAEAIWYWALGSSLAMTIGPLAGALLLPLPIALAAWMGSSSALAALRARARVARSELGDAPDGVEVVLRGALVAAEGATVGSLADGRPVAVTAASTGDALDAPLTTHVAPGLALRLRDGTTLPIEGSVRIGWGMPEPRRRRLRRAARARVLGLAPEAASQIGSAPVVLRALRPGAEVFVVGAVTIAADEPSPPEGSGGAYRREARPRVLVGATPTTPVELTPAAPRARVFPTLRLLVAALLGAALGAWAPGLGVRVEELAWLEPPIDEPFRIEALDAFALFGPSRRHAIRVLRSQAERSVPDARGLRALVALDEALVGCEAAVERLAARGDEVRALAEIEERCPAARGGVGHVAALRRRGELATASEVATSPATRLALAEERESARAASPLPPGAPDLHALLLGAAAPCLRSCRDAWRAGVHAGDPLAPAVAWRWLSHHVLTGDLEAFERDAALADAAAPEVVATLRGAAALLWRSTDAASGAIERVPTSSDDGRVLRECLMLRRDGIASSISAHLDPEPYVEPGETDHHGFCGWSERMDGRDAAGVRLDALIARLESVRDHRGRRAALAPWRDLDGALVVAASVTTERREFAERLRHRERAPAGETPFDALYVDALVERGLARLLHDDAWADEAEARLARFEALFDP